MGMKMDCSFSEGRQRAGLGSERADSGPAKVLLSSWFGFGFSCTFLVKFFC